jgi:hypothetical protein
MTHLARTAVQIVVTAALAAALSLAVPVFHDRREYVDAAFNYAKNPSPQNEAVLRVERDKNQSSIMVSRATAAGILFILMNTGWWLVRRRSQ